MRKGAKMSEQLSNELRNTMEQTDQKWKSISMDFITEIPKEQERDSIFVVVDRLTKYAHFFPISIHYKAP